MIIISFYKWTGKLLHLQTATTAF